MPSSKRNPRKRSAAFEREELTAKILSFRQNYYLSRYDQGEEALVDDEAALVIDAVVEQISARHIRHLGKPIEISLLHAERYPRKPDAEARFFGSLTLRGEHRSALAYLPQQPFWALPRLIERGAVILQLHFASLWRGRSSLLGLFVGWPSDVESVTLSEDVG
jgi:hypothetical protein